MKKIMFNDRYGLTQAVLDGRKTMTRRVIPLTDVDRHYLDTAFDWDFREMVISDRYSRYMVNEIVAVAQSYHALNKAGYVAPEWLEHTCESSAGYNNKMFVRAELMPYRIRITNIKVERLQDISDEDCLKEGVQKGFIGYYVDGLKPRTGKRKVILRQRMARHLSSFPIHKKPLLPSLIRLAAKAHGTAIHICLCTSLNC